MDNKTLSPAERAAIQKRVDAATKGTWYGDCNGVAVDLFPNMRHYAVALTNFPNQEISVEEARHNREFIAHARQDIPALLSALATAEGENQWVPVTERLPQVSDQGDAIGLWSELVIVACVGDDPATSFARYGGETRGWQSWIESEPTHWMPLPAPPLRTEAEKPMCKCGNPECGFDAMTQALRTEAGGEKP